MEDTCAEAEILHLHEFEVTEEPMEDPRVTKLPRSVRDRIEQITYDAIEHGRVGDHLNEVESLVERYPHIPCLQNFLSGACEAHGQFDRAFAITRDTVERFPEYVFAFANLIGFYTSRGRHDDAAELIDGRYAITAFAPHRRRFHESEVMAYHGAIAEYLDAVGEYDAAAKHLDMLLDINREHPQVKRLEALMAQRVIDGAFQVLKGMCGKSRRQKTLA